MNKIQNSNARQLLSYFHQKNYQAYLVGGCVRDLLMHRKVNDYDITTNATTEEILALASIHGLKVIPTGLQHGTLTLILHSEHFEVTTYRKESDYENHRYPKKIIFTNDLKEDLKRRDFTMNAICMDNDTIIDYFNGIEDIQARCIRCVGNAQERFQEDALRMLRCIRFACSLHFKIETKTYQAIKENAYLLCNLSQERIRDELCKILNSDQKDILLSLKESGILDRIIPELKLIDHVTQENPYHLYDVFMHTNMALNHSIHAPLTIRVALLFHDLEKVNYKTLDEKGIAHFKKHAHASAVTTKTILQKLKFDNNFIKIVYSLIDYHDYHLTNDKKNIRKFLFKLHGDYAMAYAILQMQTYDNLAKNSFLMEAKNEMIDKVVRIIKDMEQKKECFTLQELMVNGNDMIELGYQKAQIGVILQYLLKYVINQQDKNNKEHLLKIAGGKRDEIINCK